jgi:hypothetical protein
MPRILPNPSIKPISMKYLIGGMTSHVRTKQLVDVLGILKLEPINIAIFKY